MSNELRNDMSDDRNVANETRRPAHGGGASMSGAPAASTNPATMPTKPCGDGDSCGLPDEGTAQQARMQQPQQPGGAREPGTARHATSGKAEGGSTKQPFAAGDVGSRGQGADGYGGGGAGTEHTRGAHPRGERAGTGDDRHPGSGYRDDDSVTPPDVAAPRQAPGRPKGQTTGQQPVQTSPGSGQETTNRPGGNPDVEPRTGEKTKTYEGPTGVSGEAGSNADDV
jgi:hypothetical protein